jgi:hypothetical protein
VMYSVKRLLQIRPRWKGHVDRPVKDGSICNGVINLHGNELQRDQDHRGKIIQVFT